MAQITPKLVAEAKQQAQLKLNGFWERCGGHGDPTKCTCPPNLATEDELIANHLNFALIIMEKR